MPSIFEDLLNSKLPSSFMEAADDEDTKDTEAEDEKEEKNDDKEQKKDSKRQSIIDKIEKADVKISKKDIDEFVSGETNEIEAKEDDYDALTDAFDKVDEVEIEKDDDQVKIIYNESVEDFLENAFSFMEEEIDNVEESDDMDEPDDVEESDDMEETYADMQQESDDAEEEESCDGCSDESSDYEDMFDSIDDEFDDVLDELENDVDDEAIDVADGDIDAEPELDDEPEEDLDEVEDKKADDMLAMVATPMLLKDELTAEESVNFYESVDAEIAVEEGLIEESSLDDLFQEGVFASPNKPFKMTKKARMNQLYELSIQIEGRAHRDPLMKKLDRAYAIERGIKKQLRKKYHAPALKRARGYLMRLMKSKSGVMKTLAKKIMPSK